MSNSKGKFAKKECSCNNKKKVSIVIAVCTLVALLIIPFALNSRNTKEEGNKASVATEKAIDLTDRDVIRDLMKAQKNS